MKKTFTLSLLVSLFAGICLIFWSAELKYHLPTPIPKGYKVIPPGTYIPVAEKLFPNIKTPLFIHFFNPDCPCSRFNVSHFKTLQKAYKSKVFFAIVVLNENKKYTVKDIREKFDLDIPVFFDKNIASACGVYSTPQAALLDCRRQLFYRGNYNKARYCTDRKTNYAQMAIDSLLNNHQRAIFNAVATQSYGCELPACQK